MFDVDVLYVDVDVINIVIVTYVRGYGVAVICVMLVVVVVVVVFDVMTTISSMLLILFVLHAVSAYMFGDVVDVVVHVIICGVAVFIVSVVVDMCDYVCLLY